MTRLTHWGHAQVRHAHRYLTAAGIALVLPVVSCGLLFVGFRVADALDFQRRILR